MFFFFASSSDRISSNKGIITWGGSSITYIIWSICIYVGLYLEMASISEQKSFPWSLFEVSQNSEIASKWVDTGKCMNRLTTLTVKAKYSLVRANKLIFQPIFETFSIHHFIMPSWSICFLTTSHSYLFEQIKNVFVLLIKIIFLNLANSIPRKCFSFPRSLISNSASSIFFKLLISMKSFSLMIMSST